MNRGFPHEVARDVPDGHLVIRHSVTAVFRFY